MMMPAEGGVAEVSSNGLFVRMASRQEEGCGFFMPRRDTFWLPIETVEICSLLEDASLKLARSRNFEKPKPPKKTRKKIDGAPPVCPPPIEEGPDIGFEDNQD